MIHFKYMCDLLWIQLNYLFCIFVTCLIIFYYIIQETIAFCVTFYSFICINGVNYLIVIRTYIHI